MSSTRLLVLGVVRMLGSAYGHQVRRELLTWRADAWANIAPGSIYHALRKLARDGLLEAEEDGESGGRPERTTYRLTEAGEAEFFLLLGNALATPDPQGGDRQLAAALTFMPMLHRRQLVGLLRVRLGQLEAAKVSAHQWLDTDLGLDAGKPEHVRELFHMWSALTQAQAQWVRELIGRLEAGAYSLADDTPATGNSLDAGRGEPGHSARQV